MSFKIPCGGFKLDEKSFSLDENGVLSVSDGGAGGGSGAFVVTITEIGDKTYSADKTFEEIVSAVEKGQNVIAKKVGGVITIFFPLVSVVADTLVSFETMQYKDYNNTIIDEMIGIMKDGNVQVASTVLNVTTS